MTAKQRLEMLVDFLQDNDPAIGAMVRFIERRLTSLADGAPASIDVTPVPQRAPTKTGTFRAA